MRTQKRQDCGWTWRWRKRVMRRGEQAPPGPGKGKGQILPQNPWEEPSSWSVHCTKMPPAWACGHWNPACALLTKQHPVKGCPPIVGHLSNLSSWRWCHFLNISRRSIPVYSAQGTRQQVLCFHKRLHKVTVTCSLGTKLRNKWHFALKSKGSRL